MSTSLRPYPVQTSQRPPLAALKENQEALMPRLRASSVSAKSLRTTSKALL